MKTRRSLLADAALASAFLALPRAARAAAPPGGPVRPKALAPGARVALVSPASPGTEVESNVIAEEIVASLGLVPKRMPAAARQTMYLAGTDEERAADLNAAFRDPSIDAVWCIRGGYGSGRLLPLLDWEAIRKNPKPLLGYSDITALLNGFHARTGLVTYHAPNCSENLSDYALAELKRVLFSTEPAGVIAAAPRWSRRRVSSTGRTVSAGSSPARAAAASWAATSASSRCSSARRGSHPSPVRSSSSRRSGRSRTGSTAGSRTSP
ncbi:MAG: LD-carboxypeptidase [Holophagales bacterium]|nr:LD-carboxypeptidase [Holophagales bacterium]